MDQELLGWGGEWLVWGFVAILLFLGIPYVLAPLIVGMTLRFRLPAEVVRVDPRQTPLPEDVRMYFDQAYHALVAQGFELLDVMYLPTVVPNVKSLLAVYVHRRAGDAAMSVFMMVEGPTTTMRKRHVEFVRRYEDGTLIQTNNSDELGAFPRKPREFTTQFPGLEDLQRLYALHRFMAQKQGGQGPPVLRIDREFGGNACEYVARVALDETLRDQIQTGYLTGDQVLRPTMRGALIMSWQELWPAKALRQARRRRAADAVLREFTAAQGGVAVGRG